MTATFDEMMAQTPEMHREGLRMLAKMNWDQRRSLGMEVDETVFPEPLTMAEIKAGQIANSQRLSDQVLQAHGGKGDAEGWFAVWHGPLQTHSRDLPAFAARTILANCWTEDEGLELAQSAWTLAEWPTNGVDPVIWRRIFDHVGFQCTYEEGDCDLHASRFDQAGDGQDIVAWRGAFTGFKRGLSWTTDRDRALWFANRGDMSGRGRQMHLWRCAIPREAVLGHFANRSEHEVVADVTGLKITREKP